MASHGDNAVLLADVAAGRPVRADLIDAGHTNTIFGVTVSPDGKLIATDALDGDVRIWAADTGRPLCRVRIAWGGGPRVAFLPDSQSFITVGEDWVTPVIYDTATGRELRRFTVPAEMAKKEMIDELRLSADGKTLTTTSHTTIASDKGFTDRWDVATGRTVERTEGTNNKMRSMGASVKSPDGRWLVEYGKLSRVGTSISVPLVAPTESGFFVPPAFSKDGRLVTVIRTPRQGQRHDFDKSSAVMFDVVAMAKIAEVPTGQVLRFAFSPDGRLLAAADKEITVWDVATGSRVRHFKADGMIARTYAIAFTPDGRRLITGHDDGTALIWDVASTKAAPLTAADCAGAWADLAHPDAAKGFAAVCRLSDDPKQSLPFLKERLHPVSPPPADEVKTLLNDLNSPQFKTREAAEKALRLYGDRIEPLLRDALKANPPAEAKKRIEAILAGFAPSAPPEGEVLRGIRAVWALERIGTPESRRFLEELAKGVDTARLTREAKAALERFSR